MTILARVRSFCVAVFRRRDVEREMDQEWQFHLERRVETLVGEGMSPDEAERHARREFGDPLRWKEQSREARGLALWHGIGADLRDAVRHVRRAPALAAILVATLALTIGATLPILSLIDRVVLRPIDLPDASRLVVFESIREIRGMETRRIDQWFWESGDAVGTASTLDAVAASSTVDRAGVSLEGMDQEDTLPVMFVTANYLRVLGAAPVAGRDFDVSDEAPGAPVVAMLAHRLWRTRFGRDDGVLGRTIWIGDTPVTIVGIAPAALPPVRLGDAGPDLVLLREGLLRIATAAAGAREVSARSVPPGRLGGFTLIGRLKAGATPEQVQAELAVRLGEAAPARVLRLNEAVLPFESRTDLLAFLALLAASVGVTLVIGSGNMAALVLGRLEERRSELAVRAALGAGRSRLARQVAIEVSLVVAVGGGAALVVARWISDVFSVFALPGGIAVSSLRNGFDSRMLVSALLLTAVSALVISLLAVLGGVRRDLVLDTKGRRGRSQPAVFSRLVLALQVAVCLLLVCGAGLFIRSLSQALATDLGFEGRGLVSASVEPRRAGLSPLRPQDVQSIETLLARVRALPDVQAATFGPLPLVQGSDLSTAEVFVDGMTTTIPVPLEVSLIDADYFRTVGQRLVAGRDFTDADMGGMAAVAIVNESAARLLWNGDDPIGRRIGFTSGLTDIAVVGIARDTTIRSLTDRGRPALYVARSSHAFLQGYSQGMTSGRGASFLIVRTAGEPGALQGALREAAADAGLPIGSLTTVDEAVRGLVMPQRLGRLLLSGLSLTALAVTLIGVYGLVSRTVARRTPEIGVRLALGASPHGALYQVVRPTLVLVAAGLAAGSAGAWWSGRFADRVLPGISPSDPATILTAVVLLGVVSGLAALVPALLVLRIDPVKVLRAE